MNKFWKSGEEREGGWCVTVMEKKNNERNWIDIIFILC